MADIVLTGDTSGAITVAAPAVAGTNTLTLPASTSTLATTANVDASKITVADQWRLTATTNSGTNALVSANWERIDTLSAGFIGTGLTESSGTFSFSSTGIYLISFHGLFSVAAADSGATLDLNVTVDNSTYSGAARALSGNRGSGQCLGSGSNHYIFDVTNITTHKFQFFTTSFDTNTYLSGNTDVSRTGFVVTRLGDT